jgi:Uncharacterized alpha/beta hydrolase domain (DUF2235)
LTRRPIPSHYAFVRTCVQEALPWRESWWCCDGTWNTPRTETNIFRTYRFLRERLKAPTPAETAEAHGTRTCRGQDATGGEVLLYYDEGVGTNWFTRLAGGGTGIAASGRAAPRS